MAHLELVGHERARILALTQLLGQTEPPMQATLDCAAVRTVLWALSRHGREAVNVQRIMNAALQLALDEGDSTPDAAAQRRERLRGAVDELAAVKDLIELPNGRWLPAVPRLIEMSGARPDRLLVGGVPSSALPTELRAGLRHQGAIRRVTDDRLRAALDLPLEPLKTWIEDMVTPLEQWTREVLERSTLDPYSELSEEQRLRIYAPGLARSGAPQYFRWADNLGKVGDGRYLARRDGWFGGPAHRIVEVAGGKVKRAGLPALAGGDVRRLCYGLDQAAKNPTTIRASSSDGRFSIEISSEVPAAEKRLFAAIGVLKLQEDRHFPREWTFEHADRALVLDRMRALGVRVDLPPPTSVRSPRAGTRR